MTTTVSPADAGAPRRLRTFAVLACLVAGLLPTELDDSVFATALPAVVGELGGIDQQLWVSTGYLLAGLVMLPVYGRLGDRYGRRRTLAGALLIFVLGSIIGGLASWMPMLIIARCIQGLGGGGVLVLTQAAVADIVPPSRRAFALSLLGAAFAGGALLGPPLGGLLSAGPGWRWAFWLNLPLAAIGIGSALRWLPRQQREQAPAGRLDVAGAALLGVLIVTLTIATVLLGRPGGWQLPALAGLGLIAVAAAGVLITVERRAVEPILPVSFLRDHRFLITVIAGMIMAVAMFGTVGYLPSYLQMVRGLPPQRAGLLMLTLVGGLGFSTLVAARIVDRTRRPKWLPVVGCGLAAGALLLMATLTERTPLGVVGAYYALLGAGIGCAWQILLVILQSLVPADRVTAGTATNGLFREFGVLLGTALVGALFTARLRVGLDALQEPAVTAGLTPATLSRLAPGTRSGIAAAYADALQPAFLALAPLLLAAAAALACLPPVTLDDSSPPDSGPHPGDPARRGRGAGD